MKRTFSTLAFCLSTLTVLTACGPSPIEEVMIREVTQSMETVCMGRMLVDLPADASVYGEVKIFYGLDKHFKTVEVSTVSLNATPVSFESFTTSEANKQALDRIWLTETPMLLEHRTVDANTVYIRSYASIGTTVGSRHELHLLRGKAHIKISARSFEGLDTGDDYPIEPAKDVEARIFELATRIEAYDSVDTAGEGFCLGPVVIRGTPDSEVGTITYLLDKFPDVIFEFYSRSYGDLDPETLFDRVSGVRLLYPRLKNLREGTGTLAGAPMQEILSDGKNRGGESYLEFRMESRPSQLTTATPMIGLNLSTGGQDRSNGKYVESSFTPKEGMAIWDAVAASVRPRPGAVAGPHELAK